MPALHLIAFLIATTIVASPRQMQTRSAVLERARVLIENGSSQQAVPTIKSYLLQHPNDAEAHCLLGTAFAVIPRRSEALDELREAVRLNPNSARFEYSLASALARFVEFDKAKAAFERTISLDPRLADAHIGLALILAEQKDFNTAEQQLKQAIQIQGVTAAAAHTHYLLGEILGQKSEFGPAMKEFEEAVHLQPRESAAWFAIGKLKSEREDHKAAIEAFKKSVELTPQDPDGHRFLGEEYLKTGEPELAARELEKANNLQPNNREIVYPLCEALRSSKQLEASRTCWAEMAKLAKQEDTPNSPIGVSGALNNEGVQLENAGQVNAALEKYRKAVELSPTQAVFRRNLAIALCRSGNWQEGIEQLRQVLKQDPNDEIATKALYMAMDQMAKSPAATSK